MTFYFDIWHHFPLMQHAVRTVRKSHQRRAFFIAGNNLYRDGKTSRVTEKQRRCLQQSDRNLVQKDGRMNF